MQFFVFLDHNFSSTHSIFIILGFLEVERYQGENEVDHDSQDTVQSCTYPTLWLFIAVECSDGAKKCPKGPNASCSSALVFLDRRVSIFWLCSLENITSEAPAKLSKSARRKSLKFWILQSHCALLKLRDGGSTYE